jgi:hypothetical protein
MEQPSPLSRLSVDTAAIRTQRQTLRLVLRNTERFGLIHLYFERGRLVQVQGHKDTYVKTLADLATWTEGTIRHDDLSSGLERMDKAGSNPALEEALDGTMQQLESRGVVAPAPVARPTTPYQAPPPPAYVLPPAHQLPPYPGETDQQHSWPSPPGHLEPPAHELFSDMQTMPIASANPSDYLVDSQWQLLALVVRQVVEQAGALLGKETADGFIRQSLAYGAVKRPPLRILEMDATGWLSPLPGQHISAYPLADVADAVALLLTSFESRCASVIGEVDAHRLIANAARPFSASLAQLGLAIVI